MRLDFPLWELEFKALIEDSVNLKRFADTDYILWCSYKLRQGISPDNPSTVMVECSRTDLWRLVDVLLLKHLDLKSVQLLSVIQSTRQ